MTSGQLPVELKSLDESGCFSGYLSTFETSPDLKGDIVEPGAFTDTLAAAERARKASGSRFLYPVLWNHDAREPIGGYTDMREDAKGLYVKGELDLDCEMGRRAYSALKKGYVRGLSIGYGVVKSGWVGNRRHLKALRLDEGSIATMPVNPAAQVSEVKAASGKSSWPLADPGRAWDGPAATKRLEAWAGDDLTKLGQVHFWTDPDKADTAAGHKLPFCDVTDGRVVAVPRAIQAAAGAVSGARGGVSIPSGDVAGVKARIGGYYRKMKQTPPWSAEKKAADFNTLDASNLGTELWRELSSDFRTLLTTFAGILADDAVPDQRAAISASLEQFVTDIEGDIAEAFEEAQTAGTELEPPGYLYLGSYSASPDDGMMSGEPDETKAGRVLSSANHGRIRAAMDGLDGHLKGARGHVTDIRSMLKDASPAGSGDGAAAASGPADAVKVKAEAAEETKAADPLAPDPAWLEQLQRDMASLTARLKA